MLDDELSPRILMPFNFGEGSKMVLRQVLALTEGENVWVVNVLPTLATGVGLDDPTSIARERVREWLIERGAVRVKTRIRMGNVAEEILEAADEHEADLVVMGRHSDGRAALGSTTERVVRHGERPVLVLPPALEEPLVPGTLKAVLAAFDFSASGERAVNVAGGFARDAANLHVVHVVAPQARSMAALGLPDNSRERARTARGRCRAWLEQEGLSDATLHVRIDKAPIAIADVATELEAQLLVLGSRGANTFAGINLGSTAARVLRRTDRPVLVLGTHPRQRGQRTLTEALSAAL